MPVRVLDTIDKNDWDLFPIPLVQFCVVKDRLFDDIHRHRTVKITHDRVNHRRGNVAQVTIGLADNRELNSGHESRESATSCCDAGGASYAATCDASSLPCACDAS